MSDALADLVARNAIVDVITTLFVATDDRDWDAVAGCLAPEVVFDMSSLGGGAATTLSPAAIVDGWRTGLAPIRQVHHQAGNFRVAVRGDGATASCYGIAWHYRPVPSGRNTRTFVGSYDFELRRDGGAWRITLFRFNLKFFDGNLELDQE